LSTGPQGLVDQRTVRIDAHSPGEPISPLIYSQFIEHLGRCIYGGIWAEMLEDRKFFEPVGQEASAWSPVGGAGVRMDTAEPFVGEHTPVIALPGGSPAGLAQAGITVVAGKEYVGRVWLAGDASATPVTVSLVWGDGDASRQTVTVSPVGPEFVKVPLRFTAGASTENARFEVTSAGSGELRVGTASLMPADNVSGMRRDTLALLKELDSPLYRWPGGNFVSGYDWRDGIGDPDRRPPRKNPAWKGIEHNDFGMHEFLEFCDILGTEPLIVVNTGFGDAHSAAQEVEYVNGTANTPMGQWRAANGRLEPWAVKWWGVGNEMFGHWQLGYMAVEQYALKHKEVERAMRRVDPTIKTIGVGEHGPWSEAIMQSCADYMDLISEHFYVFKPVDSIAEHAGLVAALIREKTDAHRRYRTEFPNLQGKDIRIAMDEWNYWYGDEEYGELGVRYFWKDAMGIAAGLHEFYRQSDIVTMANYAQTVNVIGCIKTSATDAAFETSGLILKLYRKHYGSIPLPVSGAPEYVDVAAALTEDRKALTIGIVNPTDRMQALSLEAGDLRPASSALLYRMQHNDPMVVNSPGEPPVVDITEESVPYDGSVEAPPYSVSLYVVDLQA